MYFLETVLLLSSLSTLLCPHQDREEPIQKTLFFLPKTPTAVHELVNTILGSACSKCGSVKK